MNDRETLYRLLHQATPRPVETIPAEPVDTIHMAPTDTIPARSAKATATPAKTDRSFTPSADGLVSGQPGSQANSSPRESVPNSRRTASGRSTENNSFKFHDPLRRFHVALYGGVLIIAAIYMHGVFAELASGRARNCGLASHFCTTCWVRP